MFLVWVSGTVVTADTFAVSRVMWVETHQTDISPPRRRPEFKSASSLLAVPVA